MSWRDDLRNWWNRNDDVLGINRRNLDLVFTDPNPGRFRDLDDKLRSKERLEAAGAKVPRTLGVIRTSAELDSLEEQLVEHREVVVKPSRGWGGRGILVLARSEEGWVTPGGRRLSDDELRAHVSDILTGVFSLDEAHDVALLEQRVHPHPFVEELYPRGLADLRVVIEEGEPVQAMLRVPTDRSDGKANLHEGGLGLGVDIATGQIINAVQAGRPIDRHPDTGLSLSGLQVPEWEACLELSRRSARTISEVDYLGVDIVLDRERGPLVLEVNARPGLAIQVANSAPQSVRRRTEMGRFDRFTYFATWLVLVGLVVGPIVFDRWQRSVDEDVESVQVSTLAAATEDEEVEGREDVSGIEWSGDGMPLSEQDERFRAARLAAAAGDTMRAMELYTQAAQDSNLAPFALNNVALIHRHRGQWRQARDVMSNALERYPDYARGYFTLALVQRDLGDEDAALASVRRSLELRPSHAGSWGELGEMLSLRGEDEAAIEAFEQSIRFEPGEVADRRRLARVLRRQRRWGDAAERFAQSLALDPTSRSSALGWVNSRLDHDAHQSTWPTVAALDSFVAALDPHVKGRRPDRIAARLLAEVQWTRDDPHAARALLTSRVRAGSARARALAGMLAVELGDVSLEGDTPSREALELARRLDRIRAGEDPETVLRRGDFFDPRLELIATRLRGAIAPAELRTAATAREVDPQITEWLSQLGDANGELPAPDALEDVLGLPLRWRRDGDDAALPAVLLEWALAILDSAEGNRVALIDSHSPLFQPRLQERFDEAVSNRDAEAARKFGFSLLNSHEDDPSILLPLAELELQRNRASLARGLFDRVGESERATPDARRIEARVLIAEDEPKKAARLLAKLVDEDPNDVEALAALGEAQAQAGRRREATRRLMQARDISPDRVDIRTQLARVLMDRRRYEEARAEWRRILQLVDDPNARVSPSFNLALCLQRQDQYEPAVAAWDEVVKLRPDYASAHYNRALALERLTRFEEAMAGYRRVLAINPDHQASQDKLAQLSPGGSP